jgi:hypothetical protein
VLYHNLDFEYFLTCCLMANCLVYTGIILFPRPFSNYPFKILIVFGTSRF